MIRLITTLAAMTYAVAVFIGYATAPDLSEDAFWTLVKLIFTCGSVAGLGLVICIAGGRRESH